MNRRTVALLLAALALGATTLSFALSSASQIITITSASALPGGRAAEVTPLSANFSLVKGVAQVVAGVELFRIDLASPRLSDQARVHVVLLNPADVGRALGNPNAFIDVAIWHPDVNGTHVLSTSVHVTKQTATEARMTPARAEVVLKPTEPGQSTLYVLATLTVPGGGPPGGQQGLNLLTFHTGVRV